jgi:hypothetical protein
MDFIVFVNVVETQKIRNNVKIFKWGGWFIMADHQYYCKKCNRTMSAE